MAEIIRTFDTPKASCTVAGVIVCRKLRDGKWATHRGDRNGAYYWGHYFEDEAKAIKDWESRVADYKRNYMS